MSGNHPHSYFVPMTELCEILQQLLDHSPPYFLYGKLNTLGNILCSFYCLTLWLSEGGKRIIPETGSSSGNPLAYLTKRSLFYVLYCNRHIRVLTTYYARHECSLVLSLLTIILYDFLFLLCILLFHFWISVGFSFPTIEDIKKLMFRIPSTIILWFVPF